MLDRLASLISRDGDLTREESRALEGTDPLLTSLEKRIRALGEIEGPEALDLRERANRARCALLAARQLVNAAVPVATAWANDTASALKTLQFVIDSAPAHLKPTKKRGK